MTGCFGQPEADREAATCLREWAVRGGLDLERCLAEFQLGARQAHGEADGVREAWPPDEETQLKADLARDVNEPLAEFLLQSLSSEDGYPYECYIDFGRDPPGVRGVTSIAGRWASLKSDELPPHSHFLCLGVAGRSEVKLRLRLPVSLDGKPKLTLDVQRGLRRLLPQLGEASLEVSVDGDIASVHQLWTGSAVEVWLPRPSEAGPTQFEVTIRLHASSTTTVRITVAKAALS